MTLSCWELYLQDGHLVPQLALLLGREPHLIDDLYGHVSAALPVFTCSRYIAGVSEKDLIFPRCGCAPGLGGSCGHVTDLHRRSQTVRSRGRRQRRSDTLS